MNNTLHIFGCSFSEILNEGGYKPYYEYRNKNFPKTWSEILSEKLEMNLINYAKGGSCNEIIFQKFCNAIESIKENDIVIFQWSYPERFSWVDVSGKLISAAWSGWDGTLDEETAQKIATTRSSEIYKFQILDFQKIINEISKLKKFQIWYWHADQSMYRYLDISDMKNLIVDYIMENNLPNYPRTTFDVVYELGGCDIETETNGVVKDNHFGETAHKIKADLFYNHIKKYENLV